MTICRVNFLKNLFNSACNYPCSCINYELLNEKLQHLNDKKLIRLVIETSKLVKEEHEIISKNNKHLSDSQLILNFRKHCKSNDKFMCFSEKKIDQALKNMELKELKN